VCNLLIVDDHPDTRATLADLLRNEGHVAHESENGAEALAWLEEQSRPPCLILVDLRMPVMDGWDFLRAVRAVPRWANVGIIVVSATIENDAPTPVLPAKAFWSKPPDPALIASAHLHCDRHRDSWKPPPAGPG
jgi:CheY-like chemotaxis protein